MKTQTKFQHLFSLLLLFTGLASAQTLTIPDPNFLAKLLAANPSNHVAYGNGGYIKIDANDDSQIQLIEALAVDSLKIDNPTGDIATTITDLSGIASFTNLKKLDVSMNSITSLDLSALSSLRELYFPYTQVTSFDATPLTNLEVLHCYITPLASLNLNGLSNLKYLHCAYTQLTGLNTNALVGLKFLYCYNNSFSTLDLTPCTLLEEVECSDDTLTELYVDGLANLKYLSSNRNALNDIDLFGLSGLLGLYVDENSLSSLNLSDVPNLEILYCSNNNLTSLNFTGMLQLRTLNCYNNLLTTLDLSGNPVFGDIMCFGNHLTNVNLKNGFAMTNPDSAFYNNPNLEFICIDDSESDIMHEILASTPDVNFNSYCSFLDGGTFNTITGKLLFDHDNNGCDAGDFYNPYLKVNINDGTTTSSTFTDTAGNYTFYTQLGHFTLTPQIENPSFFTFTPANADVDFPAVDNSVTTQNFCMTANGTHPDLEVVMPWLNRIRPGFESQYLIVYHNKGNQLQSGTIILNFDDDHLDFISALPAINNQAANTLIWNFSNLQPFETREIVLTIRANSPTQTPPVNLGDVFNFTITINPTAGDATPDDNVFSINQTAVNSYDPNDKVCLEGTSVTPDNIGKYLHYNINFENIGTEAATNIVVKDTIDIAKFDINSLQLQYASHHVETKIRGNVVEFIFEGINLPPSLLNPIGGHGNVLFKIKTKDHLVLGDEVTNTANIFFDYNAPIQTNEARTAFTLLSNPEFNTDASVTVSPNPTKDIIAIRARSKLKSIQLFDIQGRILQSIPENKNTTAIDISNKQNGIYFLKITTENGTKVEKIIKE